MSQGTVARRISQSFLTPAAQPEFWQLQGFPCNPNLTLVTGQAVGQVTASSVYDVQTLSITGSSGTFSIVTPYGVATGIAYNISLANLATALNNIFGSGVVVVTGTPGTSYTITFTVYGPQTLMTTTGVSSGLTATIAHTTVGVKNGALAAYPGIGNQIAPTTAPTVTATGASGTLGAGTYEVAYTYVTAAGESTISPGANVTLTSAQGIQITALTSLNAAVTSVNVYADGMKIGVLPVSTNATATTTINALPATPASPPPSVNNAWAVTDGSQVFVGFLQQSLVTDASSNVYFGNVISPLPEVDKALAAPVVIRGYLRAEQLTGLDSGILAQQGGRVAIVTGTTSLGLVRLN